MTWALRTGAVMHRACRPRRSSTGPEAEFSSPTGVAESLRQGARVTRSWMQEEVAMATGLVRRFRRMAGRVRALGEAGMTTAEYAVGTVVPTD